MMKNQVKVGRVKVEMTQQELADAVGITRQTVSLIEKGKYNPSLKLCLQMFLWHILGCLFCQRCG